MKIIKLSMINECALSYVYTIFRKQGYTSDRVEVNFICTGYPDVTLVTENLYCQIVIYLYFLKHKSVAIALYNKNKSIQCHQYMWTESSQNR